jgi:hypothetical protein
MKELIERYGKDTVDLVLTIKTKLDSYIKVRKFGGVYPEKTEFKMLPTGNVGAFFVTFPNTRPIALAAMDLDSGDYHLKSSQGITIYKLDGIDMKKLIDRAESDWALAPQPKRN